MNINHSLLAHEIAIACSCSIIIHGRSRFPLSALYLSSSCRQSLRIDAISKIKCEACDSATALTASGSRHQHTLSSMTPANKQQTWSQTGSIHKSALAFETLPVSCFCPISCSSFQPIFRLQMHTSDLVVELPPIKDQAHGRYRKHRILQRCSRISFRRRLELRCASIGIKRKVR